jgi:ribosomal protein L14
MIYNGTKLICSDNSGAILVKCIGLKKASKHKGAKIGDLIVVSTKSCLKGSDKIKKGTIQYGVIIRLKLNINRFKKAASYIKFSHNNIVLLS